MSAATNHDAGDKLGTVITSVAIAISLAVSAWLVSVNLASAQRLQAKWDVGTTVSPSGSLLGISALDESEWAPKDDQERSIVLFGIADPGDIGDIEFWRNIASHAQATAPETEFVGLCDSHVQCRLPPDADGLLTLLKSMDPAQVHALKKAAEQRQAFFYRGQVHQKTVSIKEGREAVVEEIASLSRQALETEGT